MTFLGAQCCRPFACFFCAHGCVAGFKLASIRRLALAAASWSLRAGRCGAEYVTVRDHDHVHGPGHPVLAWEYETGPVVIKEDVWLASKATVVAGVTIGDHALCAAGAVVTRDVQAWQRVGGVPARPLGSSHKVA